MIEYNNTDEQFQATLQANEHVLCNFTATWCGPCRAIAPVLEQFAADHSQIKFIKVDVDENGDTSSHYGIRAMPTFMLFRNGVKINEVVGANALAVKQLLQRVH